MYEYKCDKCKGRQFLSSDQKAKEPCIYCNNPRTVLLGVAVGTRSPETQEKEKEIC